MINGYAGFDRIRSQEDLDQLLAAAKEDNHSVLCPTHPIRKDGRLVGYFSVAPAAAPCVHAWLSTTEMTARESFHLINAIECEIARTGAAAMIFPVPKKSPFFDLMKRLGYDDCGEYHVFVKKL